MQPYNIDCIVEDVTRLFRSLSDMPLVDLDQDTDNMLIESYPVKNSNIELLKNIYQSILEQDLTVDELRKFLECKSIFDDLESIDMNFDEELHLLLVRFDELCYRKGAHI
ncbi:hypothetical protein [Shewanella ulleungensis]|uniref:hypothetical protein n=1 Tax=Shewanella ulleungensis TaxID=2282699 RepID=UPI003D78D86F